MKNLYIVALFRFKENYLMDAIELLKKLVFETRKEEGCLQYDLVEDIEKKAFFSLWNFGNPRNIITNIQQRNIWIISEFSLRE